MKAFLLLFLTFTSIGCFGQEQNSAWENDASNFKKALDLAREGDTPQAISILTESIKTDSLCPYLYLANGFYKLWDFEYFGDSAIADIDRYIYLKSKKGEIDCIEESTIYKEFEFNILNYSPPREICMTKLNRNGQYVVYGLNAYLNMGKNNPCGYWRMAVDNGFLRAEFLVNKYCR